MINNLFASVTHDYAQFMNECLREFFSYGLRGQDAIHQRP